MTPKELIRLEADTLAKLRDALINDYRIPPQSEPLQDLEKIIMDRVAKGIPVVMLNSTHYQVLKSLAEGRGKNACQGVSEFGKSRQHYVGVLKVYAPLLNWLTRTTNPALYRCDGDVPTRLAGWYECKACSRALDNLVRVLAIVAPDIDLNSES